MEMCDAWAKELGVIRTDFVRSRLFDSAAKPSNRKARRFSSSDLVGSLAVGNGLAAFGGDWVEGFNH